MGMISGLAPPLQKTHVRLLCIEDVLSVVKGWLQGLKWAIGKTMPFVLQMAK
jgi:hypothetical protein